MATQPDEVEVRRSVTGAQAALVVLGLVALLVVLWFLFLRGGTEEAAIPAPPAPTPALEPAPEETAEPTRNRPLETFEVFAPRDPFRPLIVASTTGTSAATTGVATDPGTTEPADGTDTGTAPSGGSDISTGDGNDGSQNVSGRRVRLIDTFRAGGEERARIQVDGTVYTVGEGDRFAENFELVSISGECASLLYGDDQFSLCEGEEILK